MNKVSMVVCVFDEIYLSCLEIGLLRGMGDYAEITLITDAEYFNWYFSRPQKIDVLVIDKSQYTDAVDRQNIGMVFVLNDDPDDISNREGFVSIYKYSSVREIIYKISGRLDKQLRGSLEDKTGDTKTILVYSPIGGAGKTTVALNICSELADYNKQVLYLNVESVQSFHWYMRNREYVNAMFCQELSVEAKGITSNLINYTGNEEFDYIKPIQGALVSYGIEKKDYIYLIQELIKERKYDYIVIDTDGVLDECNLMIMSMCDKILTVLRQDALSVWKSESMLENFDFSDERKFMFVCNRYNATDRNCIIESEYLSNCTITQYVEDTELLNEQTIASMRHAHMYKDTAMLLL